nr:MAG TPA: hypothetical protein [Caudoviricetes sp.]
MPHSHPLLFTILHVIINSFKKAPNIYAKCFSIIGLRIYERLYG